MQESWDPKSPSLYPAIVCYADILGFSAMVEQAFESGRGNDFLQTIKTSVAAAYERAREFAGAIGLDSPVFDVKVFTDNVVVAYMLRNSGRDYGEPELGALLMILADIQTRLAADGFFLHGAIASGLHYQDQNIVYGDAFLRAAALDKSGTPPRLVIESSVERLVLKYLPSFRDKTTPYHRQLLEDPRDGRLFLNYLKAAFDFFPPGPIDHDRLEAHGQEVSANLHTYESNEKILEKYTWLATYHNYVCHTFAERYYIRGDAEGDPEEMVFAAHAEHTLGHLIDFEAEPDHLVPRLLSEERLRERVRAAGLSPL